MLSQISPSSYPFLFILMPISILCLFYQYLKYFVSSFQHFPDFFIQFDFTTGIAFYFFYLIFFPLQSPPLRELQHFFLFKSLEQFYSCCPLISLSVFLTLTYRISLLFLMFSDSAIIAANLKNLNSMILLNLLIY